MTEEELLHEIKRLQYVNNHYRKRLITEKNKLQCSWCGAIKKKATMWYNMETAEFLVLCFRGCQHFPEPFEDTLAGHNNQWVRIDPWQDYVRRQPRLQKNIKPVGAPTRQLKLGEKE